MFRPIMESKDRRLGWGWRAVKDMAGPGRRRKRKIAGTTMAPTTGTQMPPDTAAKSPSLAPPSAPTAQPVPRKKKQKLVPYLSFQKRRY